MSHRDRVGRIASAIGAALLSAALLVSAEPSRSEEAAKLAVSVNSLCVAVADPDPHPGFLDRLMKLTGEPGKGLLTWSSFAGAALVCGRIEDGKNPAPAAEAPGVPAFAVRWENGVSVFLLNEKETPCDYRAEIKLPKGLYGVEAMTLPGVGDAQPRRSMALAEANDRSITGTLPARSVVAIRVTNLPAKAKETVAYVSAYLEKSGLAESRRRRIANCLWEAQWRADRVRDRLGRSDRSALAKEIHRGMLLASQAEAMLRNASMQGEIPSPSEKLEADLAAMQNALSEISAACFDLFPILGVEQSAEKDSPTLVTLTLVNRGSAAVSRVGFALKPPEGWSATAIGYTSFARLGPGESLSAQFALGPPSDAVPGSAVVIPGDLSYFNHQSAGHLNVQVTVKVPDVH